MKVIGTAGHVDHGKSSLVLALTGINPDRLQEEQDRQMTIDLGFAWMDLPNGEEIGIVDVPGHRDFIENMLAGVGGLDAALLIIAADEGVMPQTREHLEILNLLEVKSGIVVLTKTDLIDDESWFDLVRDDIRKLTIGTTFDQAPILPVSAKKKTGLTELLNALEEVLAHSAPRMDISTPRLPIDRAFSISGFGTVVTGTLIDGMFHVGDDVEVAPQGHPARIRGLQTHKRLVDDAVPGSRVAVNITGIEVKQIQRGDVLIKPRSFIPTTMIDIHYQHLQSVQGPMKHDQMVKLFIGAAQTQGRVRVLGTEKISPGESGWIQLMLENPIVAVRGDRFILRRPSPGMTLGGGRVVDPHPVRRHRRFDQTIIQDLQDLTQGKPEDVFAHSMQLLGFSKFEDVQRHSGLDIDKVGTAFRNLSDSGELVLLGNHSPPVPASALIGHRRTWETLSQSMERIVSDYHSRFPLRMGIPREDLKSRLGLASNVYAGVIEIAIKHQIVKLVDGLISHQDFEPSLDREQEALVKRLETKFESRPYSPPSIKESVEEIGADLFGYLLAIHRLEQVSSEVVFSAASYRELIKRVKQLLVERGEISVAEVRDEFKTSRKYALALMEHLDSIGLTERKGDIRILGPTS
jgi:selenocysteine-specific elongation factor